MINLKIKIEEVENELSLRVSNNDLEKLKKVKERDLWEIVYTSFDGDNVSFNEIMKQRVLKMGFLPLNPESALGTYLVVNYHKGQKTPIIEDCLSLISISSRFFVFHTHAQNNIDIMNELPEGVLAEILYWWTARQEKVECISLSGLNSSRLTVTEDAGLHILKENKLEGLRKFADSSLKTRKVAYLLSSEKHAKHSDWMRMDAYRSGRVPLCPYTVISAGTMQMSFEYDLTMWSKCRLRFALSCDEVNLYGHLESDKFSLKSLESDTLVELFLLLRFDKTKKIKYKSFREIGIPKYVNRNKWSVGKLEKNQNY